MPLDCIDCLRIGLMLKQMQLETPGDNHQLYLGVQRMTIDLDTMSAVRDQDIDHSSLEDLKLVKVDTALRQRGDEMLKHDSIEF